MPAAAAAAQLGKLECYNSKMLNLILEETIKITTDYTQKMRKEFKHFTIKTSTKHRRQECKKMRDKRL